MKAPLGVVAVALLAACHSAPDTGAQPPADAARSRDPQASYEPRSAPGQGQQYLARMAGDWDVQKTFHRRDGGEPATTPGTCRQTMIHGGRFLQSDFTFDNAEGPSTGTGVIGFDPQSGRFTSFWVDSRSTRTSIRQSEGTFDGERVVLWSRTLGEDGAARRSRTESRVSADGQRIEHRQWAVAADGSERLVMEMVLTRHAGAR